ncbi:hypothetical protein [Alicycliphilus denitrificans]
MAKPLLSCRPRPAAPMIEHGGSVAASWWCRRLDPDFFADE